MRSVLRAAAAASIAALALSSLTYAHATPTLNSVVRGADDEDTVDPLPDWPADPSDPGDGDDQGNSPDKGHSHTDTMPGYRPPVYRPSDIDDFHNDSRYAKYYHQQLAWSSCDVGTDIPTECAKMLAPRDWHNPRTGDLTVSITRTLVDGKPVHNERLLLTNPGGPGGTAFGMSGVVAQIMGLTASHTAVDVQPRGLSGSTPIDCGVPWLNSHLGEDGESRDITAREAEGISHSIGDWVRQCKAKYPDLLPYINTEQTVRDFNLVRVLFGYEKMDYVGVSYGTWLGSYLAKAFPQRMDRVVLDSNMTWQSTWERQNQLDPGARQEVYDAAVLPWLARRDSTLHLGATARAVDATVEQIRKAATRHELDGVTPDMVDIVADGGTSYRSLGDSAEQLRLLNLAVQNNPEGRAALPEIVKAMTPDLSGSGPEMTMSLAVVCGDAPLYRNQNRWFHAMTPLLRRMPLTSYSGSVVEACAEWPYAPALRRSVMARPFSALLLHNELDPNTPYSGFRESLGRARGNLRTVFVDNGVGHGATNADAAAAIAIKYMATGERPARDISVPGRPMKGDDALYEYKKPATSYSPVPCYDEYTTRVLVDPKPVAGTGSRHKLASLVKDHNDPMWDLFNRFIDGKVKPPAEVR